MLKPCHKLSMLIYVMIPVCLVHDSILFALWYIGGMAGKTYTAYRIMTFLVVLRNRSDI